MRFTDCLWFGIILISILGRGKVPVNMRADYVVVGAGSAGCALAYRLSEAGKSVLLIENGGPDWGPLIQMPAALSYPMNMPLYDWGYQSEPEIHLGGRKIACPRGKVYGGSSSINGMVYVRGHAKDYEYWEASGAKGWAFQDVLPYFRRMETWDSNGTGGDASWRGQEGPLHVRRGDLANPLFGAFIDAGREAGYPQTDDYNGFQQEGFGPMEQTIYGGRRWSTANAYLRPAMKRNHFQLVRGLVERLVFSDGQAIGVQVRRGQESISVYASNEVILSAGAINSPKLLMLSGIGPGEHLQATGVDVVLSKPGVGQNLQDHLELYIQMASKQPVTLYKQWNLFSKGLIGLQWLLTRRGLGASNHFEAAAFIRSAPGIEYPDIQYHFLPIAMRYDGQAAAEGHGFQAHVGHMRSNSRGAVELRSSRADEAPKIRFNYMSEAQDWDAFRKCIRLTREIFSQPAFAAYADYEILPGAEVQSDDELDDHLRAHLESAYHPCGTCKMGSTDDPYAVVDEVGRVVGVEGLRVADSSIFPRITNGNLNGPSIMVGEKIADHILGRRLDPDFRSPWLHPAWKEAQR